MAKPKVIALLLTCIFQPSTSQRTDQSYIFITPQILFLSDAKPTGQVNVYCRQLPTSATSTPLRLEISRIAENAAGTGTEEVFVIANTTHRTTTPLVNPNTHQVSGYADSELVLYILQASCQDSQYRYVCRSQLTGGESNVAALTFTVQVVNPDITLTATPTQEIYSSEEELTLNCKTTKPVALITDNNLAGQWAWEYNDVGTWTSAPQQDVTPGTIAVQGCFRMVTPTDLKVRVTDITGCSRLYRCYVRANMLKGVENEQSFSVSKDFSCHKSASVKESDSTNTVVVLVVLSLVCIGITAGIFKFTSMRRLRLREERQNELKKRILTPMTIEQRDRILLEKMGKLNEDPLAIPSVMEGEKFRTIHEEKVSTKKKKKEKKKKKKADKKPAAVSAPADSEAPTVKLAEAPPEESAGAPPEESAGAPTEESVEAPSEESAGAPSEESEEAPTEESAGAPSEESEEAPPEESEEATTEISEEVEESQTGEASEESEG